MQQTEVIHSHWDDGYSINHKGEIVYMSIDCPICNSIIKTVDREGAKKRFPKCPFCGAIMDEVVTD
jgi:hypothetical protein